MKYLGILILLLLVSCKSTKKAEQPSENKPTSKLDSKTIVVALEKNVKWGHYQYLNGSEYEGLEIDLLKHFNDENDYTIKFKVMPWKNAMQAAKSGKIDLLISATASPVRDVDYAYTTKLYEVNQVLYYSNRKFPEKLSFTDQASISTYKVGAVSGYNVDELNFKISDTRYHNTEQLFKALDKGWIDLSVAYLELDNEHAKEHDQLSYCYIPNHKPLQCHWLIGKKNPRKDIILKQLNDYLKKVQTNGVYDQLEQKYIKKLAASKN